MRLVAYFPNSNFYELLSTLQSPFSHLSFAFVFGRVRKNRYLCIVIDRRTKDMVGRITVNAVFLCLVLEFAHIECVIFRRCPKTQFLLICPRRYYCNASILKLRNISFLQ